MTPTSAGAEDLLVGVLPTLSGDGAVGTGAPLWQAPACSRTGGSRAPSHIGTGGDG